MTCENEDGVSNQSLGTPFMSTTEGPSQVNILLCHNTACLRLKRRLTQDLQDVLLQKKQLKEKIQYLRCLANIDVHLLNLSCYVVSKEGKRELDKVYKLVRCLINGNEAGGLFGCEVIQNDEETDTADENGDESNAVGGDGDCGDLFNPCSDTGGLFGYEVIKTDEDTDGIDKNVGVSNAVDGDGGCGDLFNSHPCSDTLNSAKNEKDCQVADKTQNANEKSESTVANDAECRPEESTFFEQEQNQQQPTVPLIKSKCLHGSTFMEQGQSQQQPAVPLIKNKCLQESTSVEQGQSQQQPMVSLIKNKCLQERTSVEQGQSQQHPILPSIKRNCLNRVIVFPKQNAIQVLQALRTKIVKAIDMKKGDESQFNTSQSTKDGLAKLVFLDSTKIKSLMDSQTQKGDDCDLSNTLACPINSLPGSVQVNVERDHSNRLNEGKGVGEFKDTTNI